MPTESLHSVERTIQALILLGSGQGKCSINDLAQRLDMSKSATHRLLVSLERSRMAFRTRRGYELGMLIFDLGGRVEVERALAVAATPYLNRLTKQYGEATHSCVLNGNKVQVAAYSPSWRSEVAGRRAGVKIPAYVGAPGKVLLAGLSSDALANYLAAERFDPMTKHTITNREIFRRELEGVRRRGFAIGHEERELGTTSIAVPVVSPRETWFAAIGMSGASARMTPEFIPTAVKDLQTASASISAAMFHEGGEVWKLANDEEAPLQHLEVQQ